LKKNLKSAIKEKGVEIESFKNIQNELTQKESEIKNLTNQLRIQDNNELLNQIEILKSEIVKLHKSIQELQQENYNLLLLIKEESKKHKSELQKYNDELNPSKQVILEKQNQLIINDLVFKSKKFI
jgi:hypothetical protein